VNEQLRAIHFGEESLQSVTHLQWLKYKLGGPGTLKNLGPVEIWWGPRKITYQWYTICCTYTE